MPSKMYFGSPVFVASKQHPGSVGVQTGTLDVTIGLWTSALNLRASPAPAILRNTSLVTEPSLSVGTHQRRICAVVTNLYRHSVIRIARIRSVMFMPVGYLQVPSERGERR